MRWAASRSAGATASSGAGPRAGDGYQTSRVVPSGVTVDRPKAHALRSDMPATLDGGMGRVGDVTDRVPDADAPTPLDLTGDLVTLTRELCDLPSESGQEAALADAIEAALREQPHLEVLRDGDAVVARTSLGAGSRVVIAGHIDTVPVADNLPTRVVGEGSRAQVWGRGTVDMKGGVAVQLALAAVVTEPTRDVTWVFYDQEEVEATRNGLGRLVRNHPEWVTCDVAVICEPTGAGIEGGCNG